MKRFSPMRFFLLCLAVVFVVHQIISAFYKPISIETTQFYTANDGFAIKGVVIRNETFVTSSKSGVFHYMLEEGERVSCDGMIANVYQSEDASITLSEIDLIKNKIKDIEEILSLNNIEAANLDVANQNVNNKLDELILSASFGNFAEVNPKSEQLLSSLNRRQAILGETDSFASQLEKLSNEYDSIKAKLPDPIGEIKSKSSGYFLTKTDGYETSFNIDDLSTITPEFLENIPKSDVPKKAIGKIVSDYEWYIAANVSLSQSLNFKEGDRLTLHTDVKSSPVLNVTVKKINISKDDTNAVLIFSCNDMNSDLATLRFATMTVVKNEYSGLKIANKALRVVDSQRGVFVLEGMQIKFKPVEIVYTGDNYFLCKKSDSDDALRLYDQVVVKGKNLYDGKIIS